MKLTDYFSEKNIKIGLNLKNKESIIKELVELLRLPVEEKDKNKILELLLVREQEMTTGIGEGVAVPHLRINLPEDESNLHVSFCILKEPIDYDAIDGKPVKMLFCIVCDTNAISLHIKSLARIARLAKCQSLRKALLESKSEIEVLKAFKDDEAHHFC